MNKSFVNCVLETQYFKKGTTAVNQRVLRFLKTDSDVGSYAMVQRDIRDCADAFFNSIDNLDDSLPDGRYQLEVRFYPGTYEYPSECDVEYTLRASQ